MATAGEIAKRAVGVAGGVFSLYVGARLLHESLFGVSESAPGGRRLLGDGSLGRERVSADVILSRAGVPVPRDVQVHKVRTVDDRIKILRGIVRKYGQDPQMALLAAKILNRKCGSDFCIPQGESRRECEALFKWVRKNLRYQRDPLRIDLFPSPWKVLEKGGDDCDGLAGFLGSLYEAAGYPAQLATIWPVDMPTWSHVYNLVGVGPARSPTDWISADASVNKPFGWEAPGARESARTGKPAGAVTKARYWPI